MNRTFKWLIITVLGFVTLAYGISFVWPGYSWDLRLPSPDGRYDLVVLRGNKAAFDDFFYNIYLFPHEAAPTTKAKGTSVWLIPMWRGNKYLVYSGYNYPSFRWANKNMIEIDLNEVYYTSFTFNSVKKFEASGESILISLRYNVTDDKNTSP